jgi:hypothetical protein
MPLSREGIHSGRIRSHQRPTDNYVPFLGQNLSDIGEDYQDALHDTVRRDMDGKCRKDYRSRQLRDCRVLKEELPSILLSWSSRGD